MRHGHIWLQSLGKGLRSTSFMALPDDKAPQSKCTQERESRRNTISHKMLAKMLLRYIGYMRLSHLHVPPMADPSFILHFWLSLTCGIYTNSWMSGIKTCNLLHCVKIAKQGRVGCTNQRLLTPVEHLHLPVSACT